MLLGTRRVEHRLCKRFSLAERTIETMAIRKELIDELIATSVGSPIGPEQARPVHSKASQNRASGNFLVRTC